MLIYDEQLSAAFLNIAASENMVTHAIDRSALYKDPTTSRFLAKGTDEKLRRQALFDLLLHYPAVLSPFDNLDCSGLSEHGLIQGQLGLSDQIDAGRQLDSNPEIVRGVQEFVVADISPSHPGATTAMALS
ncbi:hypothetical protein [Pseudorhodoferax sp.]|uniref:hypothetical protein n=1 Tax=Pseudorhodoferax sp. TaxID=1993553 RepID=UPI0039E258FB